MWRGAHQARVWSGATADAPTIVVAIDEPRALGTRTAVSLAFRSTRTGARGVPRAKGVFFVVNTIENNIYKQCQHEHTK